MEPGGLKFSVVTIFPEMFESVLATSLLGRARSEGLLEVEFVNPRDFARDRHRSVDDSPYGGGPGMVMKVEPLVAAIESIGGATHRVLLSPGGTPLRQRRVEELARLEHIVLVCGRYEGIDERVVELAIDELISVGDYVLTGGELGAMTIIDAVARHIPGVLGDASSAEDESFADNLLEYPHYTRPAEFRGLGVPEVLSSGHHAQIDTWRRSQSLERTSSRRPDLMARRWSAGVDAEVASHTYAILLHHPVYDRNRKVVTTSVTNLDIHDLARSAATFGLAGVFLVSPVAAQREKVQTIVDRWREDISQRDADHRAQALGLVEVSASLDEALQSIAARERTGPQLVATAARYVSGAIRVGVGELRAALAGRPELPTALLFGTGWGLADEVLARADFLLTPISAASDFNHLSVRSAAAVVLDRLFGRERSLFNSA